MKLVTDWNDIRRNLIRLDQYRTSSNNDAQEYFRERIEKGHCFVACNVDGGRRLFGPSRFIGYAGNSRDKHERNEERHGGVTNQRIQSVLNAPFRPSPKLERQFREFCKIHGITVSGVHRRYIDYNQPVLSNEFEEATEDIDNLSKERPTEREQLVAARLGQGGFRTALQKIWRGRCAVTGCSTASLLRASHIKPWRDSSNKERLDPHNGLLLAPNVDAAFDKGLISIDAKGWVMISSRIRAADRRALGLRVCQVAGLTVKHQVYLGEHRRALFIK